MKKGPFFTKNMKEYLVLFIFLVFGISLYSQSIITKLDSVGACPGDTIVIPMTVENFNSVTAISLVINYQRDNLTLIRLVNFKSLILYDFMA